MVIRRQPFHLLGGYAYSSNSSTSADIFANQIQAASSVQESNFGNLLQRKSKVGLTRIEEYLKIVCTLSLISQDYTSQVALQECEGFCVSRAISTTSKLSSVLKRTLKCRKTLVWQADDSWDCCSFLCRNWHNWSHRNLAHVRFFSTCQAIPCGSSCRGDEIGSMRTQWMPV